MALASCGGGSDSAVFIPPTPAPAAATFTIGGEVSGLQGAGLVLQNAAGDERAVTANGVFVFPAALAKGSSYAVTVKTQPSGPSQTCSATRGSGTVGDANVTDISVVCSVQAFAVRGTVSGLAGSGLVLQNNAGDDLAVTADGGIAFATPVASGGSYAVTVKTQPSAPAQTCSVGHASGSVVDRDIDNLSVICSTRTFPVSGVISGYTGTGLVLQNNASDDLPISANGPFSFPTEVASGAAFQVGVRTQPNGFYCKVTTGSGTVVAAPVTGAVVDCSTPASRFAYVADRAGNKVNVFAIDATTGKLNPIAGSPFATPADATAVAIHPSGNFALVTAGASNLLTVQRIDRTTGALAAPTSYPTGSYPSSVAVTPNGKYVVVGDQTGNSVRVFPVTDTATGALGASVATPVPGPILSVSIDPSGRFLYVVPSGRGVVEAFSIDDGTGALTAVPGSPFTAAGIASRGAAFSPDGRFFYVNGGYVSTGVRAFAIDASSGALSAIPGSPFAGPPGADMIAFDGSGRFVYVSENTGNSVTAYAVNSATGALSPLPTSPFNVGSGLAGALAADPTGRFLFTASTGTWTMTTQTIDPVTGALATGSTTLVGGGGGRSSMALSY
jgi:6-phosphogluconolactonase